MISRGAIQTQMFCGTMNRKFMDDVKEVQEQKKTRGGVV